jgi:hypothetical protein
VVNPDERPVGKGVLCGQHHCFNLQGATRVVGDDKDGRERLCRYILCPLLANDRLQIQGDGNVRLDFKRPWSDGEGCGEAAWRGAGWAGPNPVGERRRWRCRRSRSSHVLQRWFHRRWPREAKGQVQVHKVV